MTVGQWAVVGLGPDERVGVVVVAPDQVVESCLTTRLPKLVRHAHPDERPPPRLLGAGATLLRSLELPSWAVEPGGSSGGGSPPAEQRGTQE